MLLEQPLSLNIQMVPKTGKISNLAFGIHHYLGKSQNQKEKIARVSREKSFLLSIKQTTKQQHKTDA